MIKVSEDMIWWLTKYFSKISLMAYFGNAMQICHTDRQGRKAYAAQYARISSALFGVASFCRFFCARRFRGFGGFRLCLVATRQFIA